jgi:hypothetical protein
VSCAWNMIIVGVFVCNEMCFTYNFTDLMSYESPCTEIWIEQSDLPTFASRIAREMLDAVPDLTNKGMCVGTYDEEGEAISYVPLDAVH